MKNIVRLILLLLLTTASAYGQSTTVSGTVTDTGSQTWNNGTFTATLVPNPQYPVSSYTWTGGTLNQTISGVMNGSGVYSVSIPSNTAITPVGTKWTISFCPNASSPCAPTPATQITGATQTLNFAPPAIVINLANPPGPYTTAYADGEIVSPPTGAQYFNTTTNLTRVWNGSAWANQGSGGGGVASVTGTAPIASSGGTTPAISCATCTTAAATTTSGDVITGAGGHAVQDSGTLLASLAPLASPVLTGTPSAPTAALSTSTTQLATTAFVQNQFASPGPIGGTTPSTGSFTTVTASAGGSATPSFASGTVGFYAFSNTFTMVANNTNAGLVTSAGVIDLPSTGAIQLTNGTLFGGTLDTGVSRGAAGVVSVDTGTVGNGLGTINSTGYQAAGTAGITGSALCTATFSYKAGLVTVCTAVSDPRLKMNFHPFLRGLKDIEKIHPIAYNWNKKGQELNNKKADFTEYGFSAKDVQNAIPEAVGFETHDGVDYLSLPQGDRPIVAALVNAVKQQQKEIERLQKEIAKLRKPN